MTDDLDSNMVTTSGPMKVSSFSTLFLLFKSITFPNSQHCRCPSSFSTSRGDHSRPSPGTLLSQTHRYTIHTVYSVHKCVQYFITLGIENFRILILNLHFKLTTKLGSIAFKNESLRGGWGGTEHYNTVYEYVNNTQEKRCYCTN